VAIFSTPENISKLELLRTNNLKLAGTLNGKPDPENAVAIVWLSMSVHGNEPSGAECSMELAHQLATQTDSSLKSWLQHTIVILDPVLNPDGFDRYTNWFRSVSNQLPDPNPESREHIEPWPGGRINHYYFDLNRDWAWATQIETQQRLKLYHQWLPHIHADLHEQFPNNPYYFAPAAEPTHACITPWQRHLQTKIGEHHTQYFDRYGWLYFTKAVFDLLYPSYGDTYPMLNGAVGMTYEQGGHGVAGTAYTLQNGDTLTLKDRMNHHLTTAKSTIEIAGKLKKDIIRQFQQYHQHAINQPAGKYHTFLIRKNNDPRKINTLCDLLDRHHIQYGLAGSTYPSLKGFDYTSGKEATLHVQPDDLLLSTHQPKSNLVTALFEPEPHLSDSLTYDITAWALPFAYGLEAYGLTEKLLPKQPRKRWQTIPANIAAPPYAWCVHRSHTAESVFLTEILQKNLRARYASQPFKLIDQQFKEGTIVITRADNKLQLNAMDSIIMAAAIKANVTLYPIFTGYTGHGNDLGSDSFKPVEKPSIGLLYEDNTDPGAYGQIWHFLEQELRQPFSALPLDRIQETNLSLFNTLILPNGNYSNTAITHEKIKSWIQNGGKLIALEGGVRALANDDEYGIKLKDSPKEDSSTTNLPYRDRERASISKLLAGAIFSTETDHSNPLGYGLPPQYFTLKTSPEAYELPKDNRAAVYINNDCQTYGFIGNSLKQNLRQTPVAFSQPQGSGKIVYLIDNPLFRGFWEQGKMLFCNALFF
jgi:hypothetical protein